MTRPNDEARPTVHVTIDVPDLEAGLRSCRLSAIAIEHGFQVEVLVAPLDFEAFAGRACLSVWSCRQSSSTGMNR